MTVDNLEGLFVAELKDVYDTEHRLLDALTELEEKTDDEELQRAFTEHEDQTEGHIDRLETVFEAVGESAEREKCDGISGMIEETEEFFSEKEPSQQVANRYAIAAAQKTERYEITAYENLIQWAENLDADEEIIRALQQNLEEENETLNTLQELAEQFDHQQLAA